MTEKAKFVIFRDLKNGYKWRLRPATGETIATSERGHRHKGECQQEVYRVKEEKYLDAEVRDLTARRSED
jgi:uncharacterized protein YegP (UPF0339 family)